MRRGRLHHICTSGKVSTPGKTSDNVTALTYVPVWLPLVVKLPCLQRAVSALTVQEVALVILCLLPMFGREEADPYLSKTAESPGR